MVVQIGITTGGSCPDIFFESKRRLNKLFKEYDANDFLKTIVVFGILFRVSGKVYVYDGDGPERLKYSKNDGILEIDLVFPEKRWRKQSDDQIEKSIKKGVQKCLDILVKEAEKMDEVKDKKGLRRVIDEVITEFDKETP